MRGVRFGVAGLLAAGMMIVANAQFGQPGGGFGGFGQGPTFLVTNKAVQEDIKATEEQVTKLKDWSKAFQETAKKIREDKGVKFGGGGGKGGFGKVDEEMQKNIAEANAEISKVAYKELGDILKKEQVDRIHQIERQRLGIRAFTNAEVVDTLKLSASQKDSVKGITGDYDKEAKEIRDEAAKAGGGNKGGKGGKGGAGGKGGFGGFGQLSPEAQAKLDKLGKEYISKIVADVLDDSQKKTWKGMIGDAFDLSKLTPMIPKKDE